MEAKKVIMGRGRERREENIETGRKGEKEEEFA